MAPPLSNVYPINATSQPPKYSFHEFFAGGGMARAGLGSAWDCLLANDLCPRKAAAYAANWGEDHLVVDDIFNLQSSQLPGNPDLSWGSFPCQDLSLAGAGAGLAGESSGAFWGYWRLIQQMRKEKRAPRLVVLENVYGALTSHDGRDFAQIIKAVVTEDYLIGAMVIDAVHFLPHSRPRVFFVAVDKATVPQLNALSSKLPNPAWHPTTLIQAVNELPKPLRDAWIWWSPPVPVASPLRLEEVIEEVPQGVRWHTEAETAKLLAMMTDVHLNKVRAAQETGTLTVGGIYKRTRNNIQRAEVRFDGVMGCLRTPSGGSSRQIVMVVEGLRVRTRLLSPREAARLMGLADSYVLPQKYNEAYHLAGDGVAVPVVAHLARHILEPLLEMIKPFTKERAA